MLLVGYVRSFVRLHSSERAASLVEYALLVALIAVVCVAAVNQMGTRVSSSFDSFSTKI